MTLRQKSGRIEPSAWFDEIVDQGRSRLHEEVEMELDTIGRLERECAAVRDPAAMKAELTELEREVDELGRELESLEEEISQARANRQLRRLEQQRKELEACRMILDAHRSEANRQILKDAASLFDGEARRRVSRGFEELTPAELETFLEELEAAELPVRLRLGIEGSITGVWKKHQASKEEMEEVSSLMIANQEQRESLATLSRSLIRDHRVSTQVVEALGELDVRDLQRLDQESLQPWLERARQEQAWNLALNVLEQE